jgi:YegS/Rv2252/BmrU family lipid kinase
MQMPPFKNITVIYNPVAGARNGSLLHDVCDELMNQGIDVVMRETSARGDGQKIASEILKKVELGQDKTEAIIAAGGDGTIAEVANALVANQKKQGTILPLGIIPLGTANVLAIEIGLKKRAKDIVQALAEGKTKDLYATQIENAYFYVMSSIGFDAEVVENVNLRLKSKLGKLAYVIEAIKQAFLSSKAPLYTIIADDKEYDCYSAIICNGRFYAGKFLLNPDADVSEPFLHVCLLQKTGLFSLLKYAIGFICGSLHKMKNVQFVKANNLKVKGNPNLPMEIDGDKGIYVPNSGELKVSVFDKPIKIIVP